MSALNAVIAKFRLAAFPAAAAVITWLQPLSAVFPALPPSPAGSRGGISKAVVSSADHFPLKSGLIWKYDSNLGEIVSRVTMEGEEFVILSESPRLTLKQRFKITERGVVLLGGESKIFFFSAVRTYQPPLRRLPLPPLRVGQRWNWEGTELVDGDKLHSRVEGAVESEETIRVPAGEFRCLKVRVKTTSDDGTVSSSLQWLAPGVGVVKALIEIDAGGLSGFLLGLLGFDTFSLELKEMAFPAPSPTTELNRQEN